MRHCLPRLNLATPPEMRLRRQGLRGKFTMRNQPQRLPSHHDSVTVWHLGHSMRDDRKRCARTKIGASVVPQYLQRGGSTLAMSASFANSSIAVPRHNLPPLPPPSKNRSMIKVGPTQRINIKAMNHPLLMSNCRNTQRPKSVAPKPETTTSTHIKSSLSHSIKTQ